MVFELTDSLKNDAVINDAIMRQSLHNLFLGYEEGNLLLSASQELLDFLYNGLNDTLSRRVINYLNNHINSHYDVLWKTKVVLENPNYDDHEIDICFFKQSSAIQPPIILCENLNDTKFYFALCREYFGDIYINTKNGRGGGGSSIADNLEDIINKCDRFCLCIVDSDVKYPGAPDGGTYAAIMNKNLPVLSTYCIFKLSVHEIENLIPIDFFCKHISDKRIKKVAIRLNSIDKQGDIIKYYDFKEGIKLIKIETDPDYYKFAEMIYNRLKKPSEIKGFDRYLPAIKKGLVFSPITPSALDYFIKTKIKPRFVYCDYLRTEWNEIRKHIVTFLCARQDDPIN